MLYLGWIVASFLAGGIAASLYFGRRHTLREKILALGPLVGRKYDQIESKIKTVPQSTLREANGQTLRSWADGQYFVSLLFDQDDICLGVMDERG